MKTLFEDKRIVQKMRRVPYPVVLIATAVVFFLLLELGLLFSFDESGISSVWPASGVALIAMLFLGYRIWPGIVAGALAAGILTYVGGELSLAAGLSASLFVTVARALQIFLGAYIFMRFIGTENPFDRIIYVFKYIILVGALTNAIGASIGVAGIHLAGIAPLSEFGSHWLYWWLGAMSSNLVISPFILVWIAGPKFDVRRRNLIEAIASLAVFIATIEVIFNASRNPGETSPLVSVLIFPFLFSFVWAAVRFGHRGATMAVITFYIFYVAAIIQGLPANPPRPTQESLLLAQFYIITIAALTLIPSAMTKERKESENQILSAKGEIERANTDLEKAITQLQVENTQRKRAQLDLERSNAELQQFAYVASHDLQEPLRMVASYVSLLEKDYGDKLDEDAHDYIGFAVEGANRMQKLIEDLLSYSRVATIDKPLDLCDFDKALNVALADLNFSIKESQAEITSDPLPEVPADCSQIAQVWQNLIHNAIKFRGQESPRIHVRARKQAEFWEFAVSDNGIGIDPKYADRAFEIFQRLGKRKDYSGTGIGLALCKRIIEHHGGTIWVESEPGRGSTFYFTIPEP